MPVDYAVIPRLWPGSTIVCIASGPSLTADDVEYCRGRAKVITVNDSIAMAPWADVAYACHREEWDRWNGLPEFAGLKYAYDPESAAWPGVQVVKTTGHDGLELDPRYIRHGNTSAYQVINIAFHLGAAKIILLGYDMQLGPAGEVHWHKGIAPGDDVSECMPFEMWLMRFPTLVEPLQSAGIAIVNCTRRTALDCFPMQTIEEALA